MAKKGVPMGKIEEEKGLEEASLGGLRVARRGREGIRIARQDQFLAKLANGSTICLAWTRKTPRRAQLSHLKKKAQKPRPGIQSAT